MAVNGKKYRGGSKKKSPAPSIKKERVSRTRNGGKWTEAVFWQMIRAALRNKTRFWGPKLEALKDARRKSQSSNKRLKWEFQCSECKNWFPQKHVEVHHRVPAGSLKTPGDLPSFVSNLFCEKDGLAVICKKCHAKHHKK